VHDEFRALTRRWVGASLLGTLLLACAAPVSERVAGRARESVVGGEISPSGTREDAVLLLRTVVDEAELVCSSSLVAKNLVITARHCVSHLARGLFNCTAQGELVSADEGAGMLGTHLPAGGLEFYTGATPRSEPVAYGEQVLSTLSQTICLNDLAFVVLDRELDLPVLPLRVGRRAERGEAVTLVGYGLDDAMSQSGLLDVETQPRTRNDRLVIADVAPASADEGVVSTVPPGSLLVEGPAGCLGDSGGPLMARETGAVLGVYSLLGGPGCLAVDARHVFADVPLFVALTDDAFRAAGAEPTPEGSGSGGTLGASDSGGAAGEVGVAGSSGARGGEGTTTGGAPATDRARAAPSRSHGGCAITAPQSGEQSRQLLFFVVALGLLRYGGPSRRWPRSAAVRERILVVRRGAGL
jgi:hypothetical protein